MQLLFLEEGKTNYAAYLLTYEEGHDPNIIAKIKEDLLARGKQGYKIVTCSAPFPSRPTFNEFATLMRGLEDRCEDWKEDRRRKQKNAMRREKKEMSTTYTIFTEVKVNNTWHCIDPLSIRQMPIEHPVIVPTFQTDARTAFEQAYRQLIDDGRCISPNDISENLKKSITDWLEPGDRSICAINYDCIRKRLNASGKEHCAFALKSEVAAFENDESEDIWDFVSVNEYKRMDEELKKAYQYYEWNGRSGAYRFYDQIQKTIFSHLSDWKTVNQAEAVEDIRVLLFVS